MIDLNHILLFIAFVSPLILLARTRQRGETNRGWRLASLAVLIVTAVSFLFFPRNAGFVGGGAWLFLLLIPAIGMRKAAELAMRRKFTGARRLTALLRVFHPAAGLTEQSELLRALELAQNGQIESALVCLAPLAHDDSAIGRHAIAQGFAIRGDWNGLLAWHEGTLQRDLVLLPLYLRALGEMEAYDDLVLQFAARSRTLLAAPQYRSVFRLSLLTVFAFGGRTAAVTRLLERGLREFSIDIKNFWIGTSELAAGDVAAGIARLEKLRNDTTDATIRAAVTRTSQLSCGPFIEQRIDPALFRTRKAARTVALSRGKNPRNACRCHARHFERGDVRARVCTGRHDQSGRSPSPRRARAGDRHLPRRILAARDGFIFALRADAHSFQSLRALCARSVTGKIDRRIAFRDLLPRLGNWIECLRRHFARIRLDRGRPISGRVRIHHGHRRRVGRIAASPSTHASRRATSAKHLAHRGHADRV